MKLSVSTAAGILFPLLSLAIGPASHETEFAANSLPHNGVLQLTLRYDEKGAASPDGLVKATGFLIQLPEAYKHLEGRVGITCGHNIDFQPDYICFPKHSLAGNQTTEVPIEAFALHPNYQNDADFVDLALVLLEKPLMGESLTSVNYQLKTQWNDHHDYKGSLTSVGPTSFETNDFKNRSASVYVKVGGDSKSPAEEKEPSHTSNLMGLERNVFVKPYTTLLGYHVSNVTEMPEVLQQTLLIKNLSSCCVYSGDSGGRLVLENGEIAVATSGAAGEIEGYMVSELEFVLLAPHYEWISDVLKEWADS